ncbi:hypothetical protein MK489_03260 [Myxococcota bacterium]|nr:hypothetical protein [Myxococcota bacterium]
MQSHQQGRRIGWLLVALLALTSGPISCKSIAKSNAMDKERLMAAAGFQMRMADTPKRVELLKSLPQRKLTPTNRGGSLHYVYADDLACNCVYVGTEKAYQRYQLLATKQRIANQQEQAAMMNQDAAMDWGAWGPWYDPWY